MMMNEILAFGRLAKKALAAGVPIPKILSLQSKNDLAKVKFEGDFEKYLNNIDNQMKTEFRALEAV